MNFVVDKNECSPSTGVFLPVRPYTSFETPFSSSSSNSSSSHISCYSSTGGGSGSCKGRYVVVVVAVGVMVVVVQVVKLYRNIGRNYVGKTEVESLCNYYN